MKQQIEAKSFLRGKVGGLLAAIVVLIALLIGAIFWLTRPPQAAIVLDRSLTDEAAAETATPTTGSSAAVVPIATATNTTTTIQADGLPSTTPASTVEATLSDPTTIAGSSDPLRPLLGKRIGLDPGHGPRGDLGAVVVDPDTGKLILSEAEFNLDVALRCRDILLARGAEVVLTRENADTFTSPWPADANGDGEAGGYKDDLQLRIDILNDFHADVFLSIHANSVAKQKSKQGIQAFYCATPDCGFPVESRRLGILVLDNLQAGLAAVGHAVEQRELHSDLGDDGTHLFVLGPVNPPGHVRAPLMPGVLVESLYVSSPAEAAQLKRDTVRQAIAQSYADALEQYLTGK
ncbi:MAG: N-acetylmuramoyl-L-alanine amidase [Chloroflexota bacterium]